MRHSSLVTALILLGCWASPTKHRPDGTPSSGGAGAGGTANTAGTAGTGNPAAGGSSVGGSGGSSSGAGGSSPGGSDAMGAVAVAVSPKVSTVLLGAIRELTATVTGSANTAVSWSVTESNCGGVNENGVFTAPAEVPSPAQCHVVATSQADGGASDSATLTISAGATGTPGIWEDVTPEGITPEGGPHGGDNFGVMDVLTDPVRPSDVYAFTTYQGVWRSTDFGLSWAKVSENGSELENGRQWSAGYDQDVNRDPETPLTLYTSNGYGGLGIYKSTDWGVTWSKNTAVLDIYGIDVDPYDKDHVLVGFHEAPGIAESTDGGATWAQIATPDSGNSIFPFFVDTGNPGTTRTTWLEIPQDFSNGTLNRTTNSGDDWTVAGSLSHPHGTCQIFQAGGGVIFAGLAQGVQKSTDYGVSWSQVSQPGEGTVVGTPDALYASPGINFSPALPAVRSAPRDPGTAWTDMTIPETAWHGAKRLTTTFDGEHDIVIAGNWRSGIWRYVEP